MRITTYEKGGNSLNPVIKLFVFFIVLGLFIVPVSAFEDDFNDQEIISDWTINDGSWVLSNDSSLAGSDDYYVSCTTDVIHEIVTVDDTIQTDLDGVFGYYEIDMKTSLLGTTTSGFNFKSSFVFQSDGVNERSVSIVKDHPETSSYYMTVPESTIDPYVVSPDTWYHIEITTTGNNIQVEIFDSADNLLISNSGTYTPILDSDRILLRSYVNKFVGSSGFTGGTQSRFDNILISNIAPSRVNSIEWDADQYIEDDTASYSWTLQNSFWQDLIYKYQIRISKDGLEIDTVRVSQTGTRYQDVDEAGTYEVKLQYSGLIFTNWQSIDSDSVNVIPQADSFINIPQTAEQKTNFTVNYLYGTTPPTAAIFIKKLNEELEEYVLYDIIYLDGGIANIDYSQNINIWGEGFYKLILYNANIPEQDLKTDVIQITKVIISPQTRINTSRIRSQLDTYSVSDMVWGDYTVDFTNYTSYVINLELYNYEYDAVVYSETVNDQCGVILIPLYASDLTIFTGLHNVRLSSYSNSGVFIDDIVYDNFTINLVNPNGYGLTLSKYEVYSDEMFVIKCIVPQSSTIKIINRLTLEEIDNFDVNSSSYINYKISKIGDYEIRLIGGSGYVEGNQYIKVVEGTIVDDPLIDEDDIIPDTTFQDNTTSLLNSPYLIGLFIMCVFLAIGATNGIGGTIVTGSIGLGIVCYMGIFPWILLVIEVLVVAVLMAKGMINLSGD